MKKIEGFFIYIIGFTGSGKLSVVMELSSMVDAVIVSSSLPYNVQIHTFWDSALECNSVPKEIQEKTYNIIKITSEIIESYPTRSKNYIFFNELIKNNEYDIKAYNAVLDLSKKMNTKMLPVILRCNLSTLQKRIELKRQRGYKKKVSSIIAEKFKNQELFVPENAIEIESSNISIKEVANKIIDHLK